MDKNTVIGFVLIAAVLIGFSYFSQPSEAEIEAQLRQDSIEAVARQKAEQEIKAKEAAEIAKQVQAAMDSTSLFFAHRSGTAAPVVLENELVRLTFNTRGGTVQKVELKEYKNQQGGLVTLFDGKDARMQFMLAGKTENIYSGDYFFTPVNVSDTTLTMRLQSAAGGTLDFNYTLLPHSYMVDFTIQAQGLGNHFAPSMKDMDIEWTEMARQQEKGFDFESRYSSLTYKIKDEGTDYLSETSAESEKIAEPLDWIAFKNQFFSCVLIAHQDFTDATLASTPLQQETGYLKNYEADMKTFFDPTGKEATRMQMLFAPNNYHLLQHTNKLSASDKDLELEDLVYLGWPLFKWINRFFMASSGLGYLALISSTLGFSTRIRAEER